MAVAEIHRRKLWVLGDEPNSACSLVETLAREFAIDHGYHHGPMGRSQRTVDDQQVTVLNTGADHGVPLGADEEASLLVCNQVLIEIQMLGDVIGRGTGKTGVNRATK